MAAPSSFWMNSSSIESHRYRCSHHGLLAEQEWPGASTRKKQFQNPESGQNKFVEDIFAVSGKVLSTFSLYLGKKRGSQNGCPFIIFAPSETF